MSVVVAPGGDVARALLRDTPAAGQVAPAVSVWHAFGRASVTCWHPRVLVAALLPLLLACTAVGILGWLYWEAAIDAVRDTLAAWSLGGAVQHWLHDIGAPQLRAVIAPMVVVALCVPLLLLLSVLLVSVLTAPVVARCVAARHHSGLAAQRGARLPQRLAWRALCGVVALSALLLSLLLWWLPPLVLLIQPLIWGWLASRVLAFDVLAHHASAAEHRHVMRQRRWTLLAMGAVGGYLAALPSLIFLTGTTALMLAPLLAVLVAALVTGVFVFAACWFAHVCLADLQRLRHPDYHPSAAAA